MDLVADYPLVPVRTVDRPVMRQGWSNLTFAHWPIDPDVIQERLPAGIHVDTFDGKAWVGLVAFRMERIRLRRGPAVPYVGTFPETNVRTYVRGPDGSPGVWFDSLDVTRLIPVLVARSTYRLPYMWSDMDITLGADTVAYTTRRRWPGARGATSTLVVRPGDPIEDPSPLERFLTARWGLFSKFGNRTVYAPVDHPAWPLQTAELVELDDELVRVAGYPAPSGRPVLHCSTGVEVRIGMPRRLGD